MIYNLFLKLRYLPFKATRGWDIRIIWLRGVLVDSMMTWLIPRCLAWFFSVLIDSMESWLIPRCQSLTKFSHWYREDRIFTLRKKNSIWKYFSTWLTGPNGLYSWVKIPTTEDFWVLVFFYPNLEPCFITSSVQSTPFSTIIYDISKSLKKMTIYVMTRLKYSCFIFVYLFKEEKVFRLFR